MFNSFLIDNKEQKHKKPSIYKKEQNSELKASTSSVCMSMLGRDILFLFTLCVNLSFSWTLVVYGFAFCDEFLYFYFRKLKYLQLLVLR